MQYIRFFNEIGMQDVGEVGGKNASLGEMISNLSKKGIAVPSGFATTAQAFWLFIDANNLRKPIAQLLSSITLSDVQLLQKNAQKIRSLIVSGKMPSELKKEIIGAYNQLSKQYKQEACDVAVRSSATAEDLPNASFAGQQESFLHVVGHEILLARVVDCMASLFTDRAIAYRLQQGFAHDTIALSVGVQKMIRSDNACSGVAFSIDTESGFKDIVMIEAAYGLGEAIVQGLVIPDEYMTFKPLLHNHALTPIIKKQLGRKETKMMYRHDGGTHLVKTTAEEREIYCLTDDEIMQLSRSVMIIEDHYTQLKRAWCPMDIEWAKNADDNIIYIIQARPETVQSNIQKHTVTHFSLQTTAAPLLKGLSVGNAVVSGIVRVVQSIHEAHTVQEGDIIVTPMTDPDWVPLMKKAAGIITDHGGRTCHAAIVSRELGIPAIVGTQRATQQLHNGQTVTLDCSTSEVGRVFDGVVAYEKRTIALESLPKIKTSVMINLADPGKALRASQLPVDGVGLARIEFIINNAIKVHPMALLYPEKITDTEIKKQIDSYAKGYAQQIDYFIDTLARSIGMIAAAFYPRPVVVRMSDFKSNEYRHLVGGSYFEPEEQNPMIGFRGASRYYSAEYQKAFELECTAMKKVRDNIGFTNVSLMLPFVRTIEEAQKVIAIMDACGLKRGSNGLDLIMMCELPANVLLIDELSTLFDGFSIGSNDLTQMTLGADRDSDRLTHVFDERNEAVKKLIMMAIQGAHRHHKKVSICGQAPSDYPEYALFLIQEGIDAISLSDDAVIPFLLHYEQELKK